MRRLLLILASAGLCLLIAAAGGQVLANGSHGGNGGSNNGHKVCICHHPPGNPGNSQTICIGSPAVSAHMRHGDSMGECEDICGGSSGNTCNDDDHHDWGNHHDDDGDDDDDDDEEFCLHRTGDCAANAEGVCTEKPDHCPTTIARVCGCDGNTYDNACLAFAAGVSIHHPGSCDTPRQCGGAKGTECAEGEFCQHADGTCDPAAPGTCVAIPGACPATQIPVCGCDGTTYSNACFAASAGVGVSATGECQAGAACGGTAGGQCATGEFCKPPEGDCTVNAAGNCTTVPAICSHISSPVCGCDGVTYGNQCFADSAAVAVAHPGECGAPPEQACGGSAGATCPQGAFCKRPDGECAEDAEGVCKQTPVTCTSNIDPVCGCDGMTYSNACVAEGSGVTVAKHGVCAPLRACGGTGGNVCDEGELCQNQAGVCDPAAAGICVTIPTVCPSILVPVCGCDGTTYSNACFALAAGVTISQPGECATGSACGGAGGAQCAAGEFCKPPEGECGANAEGSCEPTPLACSRISSPVCGCDNVTYDNECLAAMAGVAVAHTGACEPPAQDCGGTAGGTCPQGASCIRPEGECSQLAEGVCEENLAACPAIIAPVCGCDGTTYSNECVAGAAGVTVESDGHCAASRLCGGTAGTTCPGNLTCQHLVGECSATAEGICRLPPLLCTPIVAEVCGCDGVTYTNECFARFLGVTVSHSGPCAPVQQTKKKKKH